MENSNSGIFHHQQQQQQKQRHSSQRKPPDDSTFNNLLDQELAELATRRRLIAMDLQMKSEERRQSDQCLDLQRIIRASMALDSAALANTARGLSKQVGSAAVEGGTVKVSSGQLRPILARKDLQMMNDDGLGTCGKPMVPREGTLPRTLVPRNMARRDLSAESVQMDGLKFVATKMHNASRYLNPPETTSSRDTERSSTGNRTIPNPQQNFDQQASTQREQLQRSIIAQEQDVQRRLAAYREQALQQQALQQQGRQQRLLQAHEQELPRRLQPQEEHNRQRRLDAHSEQDRQRRLEAHRDRDIQRRISTQLNKDLQRTFDKFQEQKLQQLLQGQENQDIENRLNAQLEPGYSESMPYRVVQDQQLRQQPLSHLKQDFQPSYGAGQGRGIQRRIADYEELIEQRVPSSSYESQQLEQRLRTQRRSMYEQRSRSVSREHELERLLTMHRQGAQLQQHLATTKKAPMELRERSAFRERLLRDTAGMFPDSGNMDREPALVEHDNENISRASRQTAYSHRDTERRLRAHEELERQLGAQLDLADHLLKSLDPQDGHMGWQMHELGDATDTHPPNVQETYAREDYYSEEREAMPASIKLRSGFQQRSSFEEQNMRQRRDNEIRVSRGRQISLRSPDLPHERNVIDRTRHSRDRPYDIDWRQGEAADELLSVRPVPRQNEKLRQSNYKYQRARSQEPERGFERLSGSRRKATLLLSTSNDLTHQRLENFKAETSKQEDDFDDVGSVKSYHSTRNAMEVDADFSSDEEEDDHKSVEQEKSTEARRGSQLMSADTTPQSGVPKNEERKSALSPDEKKVRKMSKHGESLDHTKGVKSDVDKSGSKKSSQAKVPASYAVLNGKSDSTGSDIIEVAPRFENTDDNEMRPTSGGGETRRRSSGELGPESLKKSSDSRNRDTTDKESAGLNDADTAKRSGGDRHAKSDKGTGEKSLPQGAVGPDKRRRTSRTSRKSSGTSYLERKSEKNASPPSDEDDTLKAATKYLSVNSSDTERETSPAYKSRSKVSDAKNRSSKSVQPASVQPASGGENVDSRFQDTDAESDSEMRATETPDEMEMHKSARGSAKHSGQSDSRTGTMPSKSTAADSEVRPAMDRSLNRSMTRKFEGGASEAARVPDGSRKPQMDRNQPEQQAINHRSSWRSKHNKAAPDSNTQDSENRAAHEETRDTDSDTDLDHDPPPPRRPPNDSRVQLLDRGQLMRQKAAKEARKDPPPTSGTKDSKAALSALRGLAKSVNRVPATEGAATQGKPEDTLTEEDIEACKTLATEKNDQRRKRKEQLTTTVPAVPAADGAASEDGSDGDEDDVAPVMQAEENIGQPILPAEPGDTDGEPVTGGPTAPEPAPSEPPDDMDTAAPVTEARVSKKIELPTRRLSRRSADVAPVTGGSVKEDKTIARGGDHGVMALERTKEKKQMRRKPPQQEDQEQIQQLQVLQQTRQGKTRAPSKPRMNAAVAHRAPVAPPHRSRDRSRTSVTSSIGAEVRTCVPAPVICCPCPCPPPQLRNCCMRCGVTCCYPVAGSFCCSRCRLC